MKKHEFLTHLEHTCSNLLTIQMVSSQETVRLGSSASVDDFVDRVAAQLRQRDKSLSEYSARDLFSQGFIDFLDYAFKMRDASPDSRIVILDSPQGSGRWPPGMPNSNNVKTLVYSITPSNAPQTDSDSTLIMLLREGTQYHYKDTPALVRETFGKGKELRLAPKELLNALGMAPDGCHAFPTIPEGRDVHIWADSRAGIGTKHLLYVPRTSKKLCYMFISRYTEIMSKMMPEIFEEKPLSPDFSRR